MHPLIGIHAALGEIGALAFLWVFVELLSPTDTRVRRATLVAGIGLLFLFVSWMAGGYYYLGPYQESVKEVIKAGPTPWAHSVITETKEHVYLFLPFLALTVWTMLRRLQGTLVTDKRARYAVMMLSFLVVLFAFAIAGMGFVISSGFRAALEAKAL